MTEIPTLAEEIEIEIAEVTPFDYTSLDDETRTVVERCTSEVYAVVRRRAQDIVDIGTKLIEVKRRLRHGKFGEWLAAEFAWSQDTAANFMKVAQMFGQNPKISEFAPSALYLLVASSTPNSARQEALQRAEQGETITRTIAKAIISAHTPDTHRHEQLVLFNKQRDDESVVSKVANRLYDRKIKRLKDADPRVLSVLNRLNIDSDVKAQALLRFFKSSQTNRHTNDTFGEIERTGGFFWGKNLDKWCDVAKCGDKEFLEARDSIVETHKLLAWQEKQERIAQAAATLSPDEDDEVIREVVYKTGDIVELGDHVLICADNTSELVRNYLKDIHAALAFCDPPYNAGVADWDTGDFVWEQDYLMDHADIVAVTPGIGNIPGFMRETKMPYKWSVSAHISNGRSRGAYGFGNWIYTAIFSRDSIRRNSQDIFDISRIALNPNDSDELGEKRQKPPAYLAWLFDLNTKSGDTIIDAFGGSGASVIVADRLGRKCICIEKDEATFNAMVKRIEREIENNAARKLEKSA